MKKKFLNGAVLIFCSLFYSFLVWANEETLVKGWSESAAESSPLQIQLKVEKFKLQNGLTVLLHEDHFLPRVSYHTWFRVGSRDETEGNTGSAHMLEHMMFKGSKNYPKDQFDKILHSNGMTNNAFTTDDYTGYYQNLPSSKLALMMDIEVDRILNLSLNSEDLAKEREVVKEERRYRIDNNPMGLIRENLMMTLFRTSPYHWPTIGYMKDIEQYTVEKLRSFHKTFYVANNGVLVLVGDFDATAVKALIEKKYSVLPKVSLAERKYTKEAVQGQPRQLELKKDVGSSTFILAYPAPPIGSEDSFVLELMANIFGAGSSSRIFQKLVYRDPVATWAGSYYEGFQDGGAFEVVVGLGPKASPEAVIPQVLSELWKLKNKDVSLAELQKAKNQIMKDHVDNLITIDGKARALALNEILFGDYQMLFKDLEKYQRVTIKDVKEVAQKYLTPQKQNLVFLKPAKGE